MATDMGHCEWCSWDLYLADAVDGMHPECVAKAERRATMRTLFIPMLISMGITAPDRNNLLTDICRKLEAVLDEQEQIVSERKTTIDITPSWRAAVRIYMAVLENGSEEGKVAAREDLTELGALMDRFNKVDWGNILAAAKLGGADITKAEAFFASQAK